MKKGDSRMFKLMNSCKGAISIFLVIVLVPMLVLSSIFVDMSRLKLAKSVSESSGNLTLNTALTNYDAVLKEMYGLFATSQNTDELFDNLENYYRQCIEAAGVAEPDADNYVDQVMQFVKSKTGKDDLLNMDLSSFEVAKSEEGSLANPAILKAQIFVFMNYRAPINLGTAIFEALGNMKNLKKQNALVDNKNKFYEQQTSMMEKLEKVWNYIEDYQYSDDAEYGSGFGFPDGDCLKNYKDRLNERVVPLRNAVILSAVFLNNISGYSNPGKNIVEVDTSAANETWKVTLGGIETPYVVKEPANKVTLSTIKGDLVAAFQTLTGFSSVKAADYDNIIKEIKDGRTLTDAEKMRIVAVVSGSIQTGYFKSVSNFVQQLVELKIDYKYIDQSLLDGYYVEVTGNSLGFPDAEHKTKANAPTLKQFIEDQLKHLRFDESGFKDDDIKVYNTLGQVVEQYYSQTKQYYDKIKTYVKNNVDAAYGYADSYYNFLNEKIKKLSGALGILTESKTGVLAQVQDSESDYNKALSKWKSSANGLSGETMGANDLREIERLSKALTVEKVNKLITRLNAAKSTLETERDKIKSFKVLATEWRALNDSGSISHSTLLNLFTSAQKNEISSVAKAEKADASHPSSIVVGNNGEWVSYDKAYDSISFLKTEAKTVTTTEIKTSWETKSDLSKSPDLRDNQDELYTWLYSNFCDTSKIKTKYNYTGRAYNSYNQPAEATQSTDISSNKNNADKTKNEAEAEAENYNTKKPAQSTAPKRPYDASFLPSGEYKKPLGGVVEGNDKTSSNSDEVLSGSSSALSSLDGVLDLVKKMATELRDDLYVTNYIMNMFSYSTYESEITKNSKDPKSLGAFQSWNEYKNNKYELKSKYNKEELTKEAKTLTKVPVNPNANYLYGQEVEYIIYGDNGVMKTYGTIYVLRFALNTIYAFTDTEIGNITTAAATALFGTPPLTPLIPVAKIAMTIGFALAESAFDLYQLKCGEKVPLMKNRETWIMKPSSAAKALVAEALDQVTEFAVDEGLKVLNNVLEMTNDELDDFINSNKEGMKKLAQSASRNTFDTLKNYGNEAIQQMVDICNGVNNELMEKKGYERGKTEEKIKLAISRIDEWLSKQGSSESDVVYMAKKAAVDYLKKNGGEVIGKLYDVIGNVNNEKDKTKIANVLEKTLNEIQEKVDKKIDDLADTAGNALSDLKDNCMEKLKAAASEGAESLKSSLKEQIGATFGTSSSKGTGTDSVVSSLLSWSYSDYLQLFVLMGMVISPQRILLRTADVIELNMQQIDGKLGYVESTTEKEVSRLWGLIKYTKKETEKVANEGAYKLSKSYTYLTIKASVDVKPIMLTLPLMASTVKNQLDGSSWYRVEYEGTLGY